MTQQTVDGEKLTGEIRKFLKKVGITSQVEIEGAVRAALARGTLDTSRPLKAHMVLRIDALDLRHEIDQDLHLG
jgi:hypothetical protein